MNFNDYQYGVLRTAKQTDLKDQMLNAALGLGEAGEVQNIVKKEIFHGHPEDRMAILDELGDVLYYVAWLADCYDIDLQLVAQFNHDKLKKRYPEGFDAERSMNPVVETAAEYCLVKSGNSMYCPLTPILNPPPVTVMDPITVVESRTLE